MKKIIILFLILIKTIISQELNATVTASYEGLAGANKESLVNFAQSVSDYLNSNKFTGSNWDYNKIECNFSIFIQTATDATTYTAQVSISSQREIPNTQKKCLMVRILDNNWNFVYEKNQQLIYNPITFTPLESFLNYYAYYIIGMENDSWGKLSGTPLFTSASNMVNLGVNSKYSTGWDYASGSFNRRELIENLLNEKYRVFREAELEYYKGIHLVNNPKNDPDLIKKGQDKIANLVIVLNSIRSKIDVRSIYIKSFFDAKAGEIIEYLKDYPDKTNIFKLLKSLDPPHASKYDEAMK